MTKQERIENLEKELSAAYQEIRRLRELADKDFSASEEYTRMKQDLRSLELSRSLSELHIENEYKSNKRLMEEIRKIREDNAALCAEHGIEYWTGLTEADRFAGREVRDLEKKILNLEAKIEAKDAIIAYYRDVLGGRDPMAPKETVMGRRPVPEDQKKRIRSLRRKGYTLKEIAGFEGVSLGAVSNICKGIKPSQKKK